MRLNNFSVRVIGGQEDGAGYVDMRHGQTYQLRLTNFNPRRCDARVEIDGQYINTWRIERHSTIIIERPDNSAEGRLTFHKIGTKEAKEGQLVDGPSLGLIRVTFTPEAEVRPLSKKYTWSGVYVPPAINWNDNTGAITTNDTTGVHSVYYSSAASAGVPMAAMEPVSRSAGGTTLTGHSNQHFGVADNIEYDLSGQTVIHLRLVCRDDDGVRPLTQYSTPVPPRV